MQHFVANVCNHLQESFNCPSASLFVLMRTLISCPWSVASICPTSKSENLCKKTKCEPPFDGAEVCHCSTNYVSCCCSI